MTTWWLAMAMAASAPAIDAPQGAPILLDNRCDAAEWKDAARVDAGGGVSLAIKHDARFVYFCATPPAGSLATIDVYLDHGDGEPWNLHASAQLGEKRRGADGWPAEWTWGNQRDWYSPAVPFSGMKDGRLDFRAIDGREFQIARSRFGGASWRWMFELRALGAQQREEVVYPAGADVDDIATWAELRFIRSRP